MDEPLQNTNSSRPDDERTIKVFSSISGNSEHGMFPSRTKIPGALTDITVHTLRENLAAVVAALNDAVSAMPEPDTGLVIDQMSFSLGVDGSGRVSLLGISEVAAGMNSSISVTFKKLSRRNDG